MGTKGSIWGLIALAAAVLLFVGPQSCARQEGGVNVGELARERGLTEEDISAALKTYVPTGQMDDYIMISSGGHSGQVLVIGLNDRPTRS